jgi:hypothetical protein
LPSWNDNPCGYDTLLTLYYLVKDLAHLPKFDHQCPWTIVILCDYNEIPWKCKRTGLLLDCRRNQNKLICVCFLSLSTQLTIYLCFSHLQDSCSLTAHPSLLNLLLISDDKPFSNSPNLSSHALPSCVPKENLFLQFSNFRLATRPKKIPFSNFLISDYYYYYDIISWYTFNH